MVFISKLLATLLLWAAAALAFHYALFWGWASGTGPRDQPHLKDASHYALAVSLFLLLCSVAIWFLPGFIRMLRGRQVAPAPESGSSGR